MTAGSAWYSETREKFLTDTCNNVVMRLANAAGRDGWHIEPEQHEEWVKSR